MPDQPPASKCIRPRPQVPERAVAWSGSSYAELHCKSNFSFLEGASHPDELVQRAVELGYNALAVTDRNTLAGVVRAHVAAKAVNLKLLIGAEITPVDAPPVILLAMDRAGYGGLSALITHGRRNAPKGECRITIEDIARHSDGLLACVVPSDCDVRALGLYRDVFGDRLSLLAERHHGADDQRRLGQLQQLSRETLIPLVAANDVHYHIPDRQPLHDVLTAIRHRCTVAELGERRFSNGERCLKSPQQMRSLFSSCPEVVERTLEIASRCTFSLDELKYEYPRELCPQGTTPLEYLHHLTWQGARNRYPDGIPPEVRRTIEHELNLISELRYEAYFLTVWDLVRYARSQGILCQGRGSAANSAVCYCLEVTSVDPKEIDLLFERFISRERGEAPDIDIDFEHERREEVIQYVYEKYGRDRAGMTATLITYRPRSAVRDVGKALGLSLDRVDRLAKNLDHYGDGEMLHGRFREAGLEVTSRLGRQMLYLTKELLGFPRHLSQHVGGMVITQGPLYELVPIENASMLGRTVIEWDKDDLDALGLLKVDCLSLGMLTAIRKCFDLIRLHEGTQLTLAGIRHDDRVYEMMHRADTVGVFQIESRAQMSMLPRLKPERFYDLVIEVAIVRPGPIQGDMVHPYLRRRRGEEEITFPDDRIREVLKKTLGVPLFQEQAMKLAQVAAGFTPGESDQLRRAMAAWKKRGGLEPFRDKLITGMTNNGYDIEFAQRLYQQICGFGDYGFPESHAASFALLVYVSAWLKHHHPAAFTAALINSQPMGFYAPAQLVDDARRHNVSVLPVDVNFSDWDCTLEQSPSTNLTPPPAPFRDLCASVFLESSGKERKHRGTEDAEDAEKRGSLSLRLGFRMIAGLSETSARKIVHARTSGPFRSIDDLVRRTGLLRREVLRLTRADAFKSIGLNRRDALWNALPGQETGELLHAAAPSEPRASLPQLASFEEVTADYQATGLSLKAHPFSFLRDQLEKLGAIPHVDLQKIDDGATVKIAGLVLLRQRPGTAKGITFMAIEDETGQANLVVWQNTWERHRRIASHSAALLITGKVQKAEGIIHVVVRRLQDLSKHLSAIPNRSRDFR